MPTWIANFLQSCLDFSGILNTSITASWVVLAVLVLRFLLKKAPKWTHVALWGLVALRLLLPFSIERAFSLIPSTETLPTEILRYEPVRHSEPARLDIVTNPVFSEPISVELPQTVERIQWNTMYLSLIWWGGILLMVLYALISYKRLRRRVSTAVRLRGNIWQSEHIPSPFVLGILRPRIYLPFAMSEQDRYHVIAHEKAHIRRKDHWWKPLGFLLLTFHWFNPLMWLSYILLCRDIELACDERVIRELGTDQRADYSEALLKCSINRSMIAACPLAFGEVGVKERVRNVLNYKRPAFWIIAIAVIVCIVVAVCFLTDPVSKPTPAPILHALQAEEVEWAQATIWEQNPQHIMLSETQIADLMGILNNLDEQDFIEAPKYDHAMSLMIYCGEQEILLHCDGNFVAFIFDSNTAEAVGNASWAVCDSALNHFLTTIYPDLNIVKTLSINDIVSLAEKGKNLSWEDFEGYASEEIGSGMYILRYEIDDVFHLRLGGTSPEDAPGYIRLCTNSTNEYIDLTTDDPLPFIQHYSGDYSASDLHAITEGLDYTVTDQQDAEITLSVRSSILTDACFTKEGRDFQQGEVIAYQDSSTCIWLKRVQVSNENDDLLYFMFQPSFAIGDTGNVLSSWRHIEGNEYRNAVSVTSETIKTGWDAYPDTVFLRGQGPGEQFTLYVSADACRSIEGRMVFQVGLNKISYQRNLAGPESISVSDYLEEMISAAILENSVIDAEGLIHVESHIILANEQKMTSPLLFWQEQRLVEETFYILVMESGFRTDTGVLVGDISTSVCPVAITFSVDPDGKYTLKEYWEPRDGSHYNSDIRSKFPTEAADAYFEYSGSYTEGSITAFDALHAENKEKAEAYVAEHGTTYTTVEYLLREILPYDATAKNPQMWLDESPEEYQRLLDFGTGTLYYCFSQFLKGGQTDMRGHIMALLCQQIMEEWSENYDLKGGGQDWFDAFRRNTEALSGETDLETIQKHHPGAYLLMEMTATIIPAPAVFTFRDTADLLPPSVTLQEDGSFWFHFSALSSYIGHGEYTIEDGRLILPTDDGRFTYYFDILDENTLAFDGEASSDMVWFSELRDGDLFIREAYPGTAASGTPLEELPDNYSVEQAEINGCLIIRDDFVFSNQDGWDRFLWDAEQGGPAFLRVYRYYTDPQGRSYETQIYDLYYDGSVYTLKIKDGTHVQSQEFTCLRYFYSEVTDGSADYDAIERYVLTNDRDASWEEIRRSDTNSHYVAYTNLYHYADRPTIPELTAASLEMDGQTLVSVTDKDTLARLRDLLSGAEEPGYAPKTCNLGVSLVLTTPDGVTKTLWLDLKGDLVMKDFAFYDYGPGYTDVGAYNGQSDLLTLFGLDRWPDAVYEKYADWLGPIPTGEAETEPVDHFPQGSIGVWYPDWTYGEITGTHPLTILETLGSIEPIPTDEPQPSVEDAEYTLHIAYNSGDEFDLVYIGNDRFFYRVFKTQEIFTFTSPTLREVIAQALP